MKPFINISVDKNTTQEERNEIRRLFSEDKDYQGYRLNIIVSGDGNFKDTLKDFIKATNKV